MCIRAAAPYSAQPAAARYFFLTTKRGGAYWDARFQEGDYLVFGNETVGLPNNLLENNLKQVCNIPIKLDSVRSLNLSNCAAIVLYEALRQINI